MDGPGDLTTGSGESGDPVSQLLLFTRSTTNKVDVEDDSVLAAQDALADASPDRERVCPDNQPLVLFPDLAREPGVDDLFVLRRGGRR